MTSHIYGDTTLISYSSKCRLNQFHIIVRTVMRPIVRQGHQGAPASITASLFLLCSFTLFSSLLLIPLYSRMNTIPPLCNEYAAKNYQYAHDYKI